MFSFVQSIEDTLSRFGFRDGGKISQHFTFKQRITRNHNVIAELQVSIRKRRDGEPGGAAEPRCTSFADHYGEAAEDDYAAVDGGVADTGGHQVAGEHGGRAHQNRVRRANAGSHICGTSGRKITNEDGGAARWEDGTADVRDDAGDHWANVHGGDAGCWGQVFSTP